MQKVISFLSVAALLLASISSAFAFSDVSENALFYPAVSYLSDEGVVTGYPDGSFGYNSEINRAELLTIIVKAKFKDSDYSALEPYKNIKCFSDVKEDAWFTEYICYAKDQGWVAGYPDKTFKPGQSVNFVEALKIVLATQGFEYETGVSPWYKGVVDSASSKKMIPVTIHDFEQAISRGEMSDMLARAMKHIDGSLNEWLGDLGGAVLTYDLIANKGFWVEYDIDVNEPGVSMDLNGYYLGISNCGGEACFDEEFSSCAPKGAFITAYVSDTLSYRYEIVGKDGDKCNMKSFYPSNPNPEWENKEMVCEYDNSKSFDEAVKGWNGCEGELWDLMNAPIDAEE